MASQPCAAWTYGSKPGQEWRHMASHGVTALCRLDLRQATPPEPAARAHPDDRSPWRLEHLVHALSPAAGGEEECSPRLASRSDPAATRPGGEAKPCSAQIID